MYEFKYRIKRHLQFSNKELRDLGIALLIVAFIFAYDDKSEVFIASHWIANLFKILFMIFITFLVHELGHKIFALYMGMHAYFRVWPLGLFLGAVVAFISGGVVPLILPGRVEMKINTLNRLGHFRYGRNLFTGGFIAMAGPVANLLFATFFKTLSLFGIAVEFFDQLTFINLYYAVFAMLPLHMTDGVHMFYASRNWYVIIFASLVGYILLYMLQIYSLIFALLIGLAAWFLFYYFFESQVT